MTEDNHDALIARTSSYALKAQQAFDNTMAEIMRIVRLSRLKPDFQNGQMYSFREEPALRQARVEQALRRLQSIVVTAAERGIALEWQRAEADMTELMNSVYGPDAAAAIRAEDKGRGERNTQARQAFIARSDRGMNLSSRVWQSCAQLRDQMEMAITVALGDGTSAQEASRDRLTSDPATLRNVSTRDIRKYLNDPDLCFRRFRYKDQNGNWSRKWKKRIRDPKTGRVTWQDWDRDSYIPKGAGSTSRGVYKSAYKNAMRVTRTETNMAYRNADYEQWLNNPNVLGIHIEPFRGTKKSRGKGGKQIKHIPDICDRLAGDYPKTFRLFHEKRLRFGIAQAYGLALYSPCTFFRGLAPPVLLHRHAHINQQSGERPPLRSSVKRRAIHPHRRAHPRLPRQLQALRRRQRRPHPESPPRRHRALLHRPQPRGHRPAD